MRTAGLVLLLVLLLGSVLSDLARQGAYSPSPLSLQAMGAQWHDDLAKHVDRAEFIADRMHAKRAGGKSTDDGLAGPEAHVSAAAIAQAPGPHSDALTLRELKFAAFRARAPPRLG